jgi:predicted transcriptional regulator
VLGEPGAGSTALRLSEHWYQVLGHPPASAPRGLGDRRESLGLSQTVVAARMHTSQSAVARLESAEIDARLSTVERSAAAVGKKEVEARVGDCAAFRTRPLRGGLTDTYD